MGIVAWLRRAAVLGALLQTAVAMAGPSVDGLKQAYERQVDRRWDVPTAEVARYAQLTQFAFDRAGVELRGPQYVVTVDRDPQVQVVMLLWRSRDGRWRLVGASPASTGRPGSFDHFETPTGAFEHSPANMDFRAEGTLNENGIRGYGRKGMRVFDFGWQMVPKGWGDGNVIEMRLQMHATDPDLLEPRLGSAQSKGCIRIPATLNTLLDHYGVIDASYDTALTSGQPLWVLPSDRDPVADAGRYLVVVDSERTDRPDWAPAPHLPHRRR